MASMPAANATHWAIARTVQLVGPNIGPAMVCETHVVSLTSLRTSTGMKSLKDSGQRCQRGTGHPSIDCSRMRSGSIRARRSMICGSIWRAAAGNCNGSFSCCVAGGCFFCCGDGVDLPVM